MWTFQPIYKSTLWGGDRISRYKGTEIPATKVGESWELSGVKDAESLVADGPDKGVSLSKLIERYGSKLLGERNYSRFGTRFPLLVKFIDASKDLSVQVHPDDELAQKRGMANGKTEMWYILDAEKGAKLVNGFQRHIEPEEYQRLVHQGAIEEALNTVTINKGDVYFIPSGRVHSIGAGAFLMEVQQTSDATYRIYDYCRRDSKGKLRELHLDEALEAIDYSICDGSAEKYTPLLDIPVCLVRSQYFSVNMLMTSHSVMRDYSEADTFVILVCTEGTADISCGDATVSLPQGHTVLIPASAKGIEINPAGDNKVTLIEISIP